MENESIDYDNEGAPAAIGRIIDVSKDSKRIMPRWQKITFTSIGIFALLCSLGAYFFRVNLFKELIKPNIPFQVDEEPNKPNYNEAASWAIRPQNIDINGTSVAVFYIHPTTYYNGKSGWNADYNDARARQRLDEVAIPNHIKPFAAAGEIWLPLYRQATLFANMSLSEDAKDALNLAYKDVESAFENFVTARPAKSNFVIVGVNQGGLHALRLIESKIANTEFEKNMLAAYLIDQPVPKDFFEQKKTIGANLGTKDRADNLQLAFGNLRACDNIRTINCIISYNIVDNNDDKMKTTILNRALIWEKQIGYSGLGQRPNLCFNPLNNGRKANEAAQTNEGSAAANGLESGLEPALLPAETGANCVNGLLEVDSRRARSLKPPQFELGAKFKTSQYNLFYSALTKNAARFNNKVAIEDNIKKSQ